MLHTILADPITRDFVTAALIVGTLGTLEIVLWWSDRKFEREELTKQTELLEEIATTLLIRETKD